MEGNQALAMADHVEPAQLVLNGCNPVSTGVMLRLPFLTYSQPERHVDQLEKKVNSSERKGRRP